MWLARWRRKRGTCPDCGKPVEECSDPDRVRYPFRRVCYETMEVAAARAMYEKLHEDKPFHDGTFRRWSKTRSLIFRYHYNDGVTPGVADEDLTPGDEFTTKENASPVTHEAPASDREIHHREQSAEE